jgi:hypothetical protein
MLVRCFCAVVECHGSIHFLQPFDNRLDKLVWPAAETLKDLRVNHETFLAEGALPVCPPQAGTAAGTLARPNILMFGDWGWDESRTAAQEHSLTQFVESLPREARLVVVEVGAGVAIPTVRHASEGYLDDFPNARLLRINLANPRGPVDQTVAIPVGGKHALTLLDEAIGGAASIGADRA